MTRADIPPLAPSASRPSSRLLRVRSPSAVSIDRQRSANGSTHTLASSRSNGPAPATTTTTQPPPSSSQAQQTSPGSLAPSRPSKLSLRKVSKLKMMAAQQHKKIRCRARLATTLESDERDDVGPAVQASLPRPPRQEHVTTPQPIASFATNEITWKAVIRGELEKFMYPSLRLEALYESTANNGDDTLETWPQSMPTLSQVEQVTSQATTVQWEMEKRFQNSRLSAPEDGHARLASEEERRRIHFDMRLETAEGLLRKKDMHLLDVKREHGVLEALGTKSRTGQAALGCMDTGGDPTSIAAASVVAGRERGVSLYQPDIIKTAQVIPRLPHTRKYASLRTCL